MKTLSGGCGHAPQGLTNTGPDALGEVGVAPRQDHPDDCGVLKSRRERVVGARRKKRGSEAVQNRHGQEQGVWRNTLTSASEKGPFFFSFLLWAVFCKLQYLSFTRNVDLLVPKDVAMVAQKPGGRLSPGDRPEAASASLTRRCSSESYRINQDEREEGGSGGLVCVGV